MSKIGVQSQSGVIQDATRLASKHPIAWKLLGNALSLDFAKQLRAIYPNIVIVLRAQPDNWDLNNGVLDYASRAMAVAHPFLNAGVCDFLEPPNEPIVYTTDDAKRLNDQMWRIAGVYKQNGYATLAYQFSVGNPSYPLWQYLNDGIVASNGWLGLHEYGAPNLYRDADNLALRHRRVRPLLNAQAQGMLKVAITECGIDLGIGRPPDGEPTRGGYRALRNPTDDDLWWIRNYTQQLDWYDSQLAQDAYVKFTTLFGYAMNEPWTGLGFNVADVDTDRAFYIAWQKAGDAPIPPISFSHSASASASASHSAPPEDEMQTYQPFTVPPQFAPMGWTVKENPPIADKPFYRLGENASFLSGVNVYCQVCVIDQFGAPVVGAKVVTIFPDNTNGIVLQTDAKGCATFNGDTNWAFSPPAPPPMLCFIADDSAYKDNDSIPKRVVYKEKWSDEFRYGDTNAEHTQGNVQMVLQVVMPDATSRDDAIRLRAYPAKALTLPVYCEKCALQAQGRARGLGAVLSDEFYVTYANIPYVCQAFAKSILATIVGHYAPSDFFTIDW